MESERNDTQLSKILKREESSKYTSALWSFYNNSFLDHIRYKSFSHFWDNLWNESPLWYLIVSWSFLKVFCYFDSVITIKNTEILIILNISSKDYEDLFLKRTCLPNAFMTTSIRHCIYPMTLTIIVSPQFPQIPKLL